MSEEKDEPNIECVEVTFMLPVRLEKAEATIIKATLNYFKGDKRATAKSLGISLKTVYNKLGKENRS